MFKLTKVPLTNIETLRDKYFHSMPEFQELFIELMVPESDYYTIITDKRTCGYAIVRKDNTLIEFFLVDSFLTYSSKALELLIEDLSIKSVYCKSFDHMLLNICLLHSFKYKLLGSLFRRYKSSELAQKHDLNFKLAVKADHDFLMFQKNGLEELFETDDELASFIASDSVYMAYKDNQLVGCGTIIQTHPKWNYCDLGIWVKPEYRKQDIATQILTQLRKTSINKGWNPTCGCDINNIASQKTIEKSGFISIHKLIEFTVVN